MAKGEGVSALAWYSGLPREAHEELDAWLEENPPPEGKSQIQHAYENRREIFNEEGDDEG